MNHKQLEQLGISKKTLDNADYRCPKCGTEVSLSMPNDGISVRPKEQS